MQTTRSLWAFFVVVGWLAGLRMRCVFGAQTETLRAGCRAYIWRGGLLCGSPRHDYALYAGRARGFRCWATTRRRMRRSVCIWNDAYLKCTQRRWSPGRRMISGIMLPECGQQRATRTLLWLSGFRFFLHSKNKPTNLLRSQHVPNSLVVRFARYNSHNVSGCFANDDYDGDARNLETTTHRCKPLSAV